MAAPETERKRRTVMGVVTSDKMDKTIAVAVQRLTVHPRFKKYIRKTSRYKAHDENEEARVGDTVRIAETRPLSKTKHWRLVEILDRAPRVE
jgi:small subunit ribosomal protein S17